ncbi:MAG TPA: hypothetical protein VJX70_05665 [Candidatus Acidoferrum sp.]|nr:hypothetical protein [Candidatus Acidoferrum sp.]
MKWRMAQIAILAVCAGVALGMSGCGSSSANVITVTVTPSAVTVLAGQIENFTATVGGSSTLTVQWTCTYVYTPLPTTAVPNPTPTKSAPCTSGSMVNGGSIGTWVVSDTNGSNVLTYTAPELSSFPNPAPIITFTAAADADHNKTGTGLVGLDSGIRVAITPATATVPVGITPAVIEVFSASFLNTNPQNSSYLVTQPNSGQTTNLNNQTANPLAATCSPTCGTINNNGQFTAPATLPTDTTPAGSTSTTPTTVYVVAWNTADSSHYAVATITLVSASSNSITFSSLYPQTIAGGGLLQDVFLSSRNLLNTTEINFVSPTTAASLTASSGSPVGTTQIFTIPISTEYCSATTTGVTPVVTCDASIMTRVRLQASQLAQAEPDPDHPAWILMPSLPGSPSASLPCIQVPGAPASTTAIACPLHIVNASPALVSEVPDSFPQVSGVGTISLGVIGGYYGSTGGLVDLRFDDQATIVNTAQSGPTALFGTRDNGQLPPPGLYEVSINSSITQGTPPMFPTVTTNAAVQPNFTGFTPNSFGASPSCIDPITSKPLETTFPDCMVLNGTGNAAPTAIALNSAAGYAVVVEQGTNALQLIDLTGSKPVQVGSPFSLVSANSPTASQPTDFAIDNQLSIDGGDLGIVMSSGDSTLYLYAITPKAAPYFTFVKGVSVDLRTLLGQPSATGLPAPISFGVDPGTHLGVVAYVSTNIGFIVDVNPNLDNSDTHTCFVPGQTPPCVIAPVSINTGPTPKVVMQPNAPLAYVTPGGGYGSTSVVNLLQQGTNVKILPFSATGTSGATRTAGITLIHTTAPHGINPILGGTVIIAGVTTSTTGSNFNGTYNVIPGSVTDPYTFSYPQTGQPDDTETNTSSMPGSVEYGTPYYSFSTSTNVSGAAINNITRTFAYADFNQSSAQIGFISTLDQSLTSLTLTAGSCNGCTPNPNGAPEIGFRSVAFDPFTDVLMAFNPSVNSGPNFPGNAISLINPGGIAPGGATNFPYRIIAAIPTGQVGTGSYTPTGQTTAVPVYGPMTYDPKSKYVLVANAGSNTLTYMNLDPGNTFQQIHVQQLLLKDNNPGYGVPVIQPPLSTSAPATAPATCSLTDPTQPCMPQAVQVGQTASLRILGQGFTSGGGNPVVRLDGQTAITPPGQNNPIPITATLVNDNEVDVTIPGAALFSPHDYALDVQASAGGATSNAIDLHVVKLLDMSPACKTSSSFPQGPEGVAVDTTRQVALVTNYACNSVSVIAINPSGFTKSDGTMAPYGTILATVTVGNNPLGIGVIPRLGYAVVANSGDTPSGTASIIDYHVPDSPTIVSWPVTAGTTTPTANTVTVGLSPLGVSIDQDHALALVANSGSNTLSSIDLTVLFPSDPTNTATNLGHVQAAPVGTTVALSGPPTAIAVDPNRAIAVVTNLQNSGTTAVTGGLDVVSLATSPPVKSSTASVSSLAASLTGIVYDPGNPNNTSTTTLTQTGLFYATSTQANAIYSFNPDIGSTQTIRVGINPYSLGFNYQTGTLLTINSTSNTSSVVDTQNFKTRQTLGISSMSQFAIDVDNLTNISVIADQNNNRVVFLAMPK